MLVRAGNQNKHIPLAHKRGKEKRRLSTTLGTIRSHAKNRRLYVVWEQRLGMRLGYSSGYENEDRASRFTHLQSADAQAINHSITSSTH